MPKTAFLFPGQGAQVVGMGRQLYDTLPAAQKLFDDAGGQLGYSLIDVCANGPAERLNSTEVSQPALFVAGLAALESLRASDPVALADCVAAAGLSLGEYTALTFAGVLDFADGLRLVQRRGQAMQAAADATPSAMVAVLGLSADKVEELCAKASSAGLVRIANYLCPGNIVVSGDKAACALVESLAPEAGAMKAVRLNVAGAFHTSIMKPADEQLAAALQSMTLHAPRIPVWSNVDAQPHADPAEIKSLLIRQVLEPVLWETLMRNLRQAGVERFYELGPGRVIAGLLKRIDRKMDIINISG